MVKRPSQSLDKFIIRLPNGMRDRIKRVADSNKRSMTDEIVLWLDAALGRAEQMATPPSDRDHGARIAALEQAVLGAAFDQGARIEALEIEVAGLKAKNTR